jgi:hypothetical protein
MESTGLRKDVVSRALRNLKEKRLIIRNGKLVGFNKDYESWQNCQLRPVQKLAESPTKLAELSTKVDSPLVTQKKYKERDTSFSLSEELKEAWGR